MIKVNIEFTDGVKYVAICNDCEVDGGCVALDLSVDDERHGKLLPLHTIACIDITITNDTEVFYGKA